MLPKLILKRGKDKPLRQHHPWIFSGAIQRVEEAQDGDTVDVYDADGQWLARAAYNSRSQIAARIWTFDPDEQIDAAFLRKRLERAAQFRMALAVDWSVGLTDTERLQEAVRLVNAESDGLPGVVVDDYAGFFVVQLLTLGAERLKETLTECLQELFAPVSIYERSDVDVRKKEGLTERVGVLAGAAPPERVEICENGLQFLVDVKAGHKTGFYLDQRENRARAARYLRGEVLNVFSYTGAFGVYAAARHGAEVTNLDASASALELAAQNYALNSAAHRSAAQNVEFVTADAFQKLRDYKAEGRLFDAIVLDPPKFATSRANLERAARGYKDLNLLALQLLNPNGHLVTFSCSGLVSPDLFQKIVFGASVDAFAARQSHDALVGRSVQIVEKLGQSPDHPIGLNFPEGEYLKGLALRVV